MLEELRHWVFQLPHRHFLVLAGMLLALAGLSLVGMISRLRRLGVLENTATSKLRSAAQGYVELKGNARMLPGEPVRAGLSGRRCVWWAYRVEERGEIGGDARSSAWEIMDRETSDAIFSLADETGSCIVDPEGAEITGATARTWYGDSRRPPAHEVPERWGIGKRYRYTEWRIEEHEPLYAAGYLISETGGAGLGMEEEIGELIRAWKRRRETLLERFDRDGDGDIDLGEWEVAREQARSEIMAQRRKVGPAPMVAVLAKPRDGRPFVLAAGGEQPLRRRWRRQLAIWAISFVFAAVALAWIHASRGSP
jgi:hypothetical protein